MDLISRYRLDEEALQHCEGLSRMDDRPHTMVQSFLYVRSCVRATSTAHWVRTIY